MVIGAGKFRKVVKKMGIPCCSFSTTTTTGRRMRTRRSHDNNVDDPDNNNISSSTRKHQKKNPSSSSMLSEEIQSSVKSLCAICLEALSYSTGSNSPGQAIFTAQCSHAFHFTCISSNVRHGSITCPICRAQWTQLPRNLHHLPCSSNNNNNNNGSTSSSSHTTDPILRILDDSIATFRVHRRSSLRSARYNDDDPIEPPDHEITANHLVPRLHIALLPVPLGHTHNYGYPSLQVIGSAPPYNQDPSGMFSPTLHRHHHHHHHHHLFTSSSQHTSPNSRNTYFCPSNSNNRAYLSVKLAHQQPTDLVLVASPNGPHLRLLKQSMALVVFSLRSVDRLAIVTYSSAATRAFPLRRMTSHGKRTALQVIDRLFYMGEADPGAGLKKGMKILEDRTHRNPESCILHLSDCPTRSYQGHDMVVEFPIQIHRFHVGFGFGTSNGFVMHEFEEFLARLLGGVIRETQLRIGDEDRGGIIRLGELRGGEERRIPLDLGDNDYVSVSYSYIERGVEEFLRTGEIEINIGDKSEDISEAGGGGRDMMSIGGGRTSNAESWDYHDPYMARRWAKHLHGYRL